MKVLMRKVRVALTPRHWLLKAKLANGAFVYGANREGFGGRGIYIFRESIETEFQHLELFLDTSGVFVDIGANTGIYTIKAAKHFAQDGGIVLAIEPFPDVLATLFHSIEANSFTNVRLRNFCAGDRTGSATLWRNFNKPHSFSLIKRDEKASRFSTLTVALDDLFPWEGLKRLDYLKIDAEGAEQQILSGARRTIEEYRPIIQLEVIVDEAPVGLADYSVFQAPGSPNKVYIPNENARIKLPTQLGWIQLTA